MSVLDTMIRIKEEALVLQSKLVYSDAGEFSVAMKEYEQLVDCFYQENVSYVAPQQYKATKKDFQYFMILVELALAYHAQKISEKGN